MELRRRSKRRIGSAVPDHTGSAESVGPDVHPVHLLHWLLIVVTISLLFIGCRYIDARLVEPKMDTPENRKHLVFIEERARKCLVDLTSLGPRVSGGPVFEDETIDFLTKSIDNIRSSLHKDYTMDVDVHRPSACYTMEMLGHNRTTCYRNLTNVVVRVSRKGKPTTERHALLLNSHPDTVPESPGATDDGVSCCIMLEILRIMVQKPPLQHDVIFLFNGGEENGLQASHGFITQHPWRHTIRSFINLEGAGAGGREMLFQAGPGKPYLIQSYLANAPYPHTNVLGQELFQKGLIPSDTDFRVFRDYGLVSGLDIAYVKNGYVYHTEFDAVNMIPPGSIQRAGENVLQVTMDLANSSYLSKPSDFEAEQQRVVFFDVLGLLPVHYPYWLQQAAGYVALAVVAFVVLMDVTGRSMGSQIAIESLRHGLAVTVVASGLPVLSKLYGIVGITMLWYARPWLLVPLFAVPLVAAALAVHAVAKRKKDILLQFRASMDAQMIVLSIILLVPMYLDMALLL